MLSGCSGLSEQAPIGKSFAPPVGWHELPMPFKVAINPVLGMWTQADLKGASPAAKADSAFIMLMRLPPTKDEKALSESIVSSSGNKDAEIVSKKAVTLCNGVPGLEIEMKTPARDAGKQPLVMQVVVGQGKTETLLAIYSRVQTVPADPAAINSIEKLCPASSAG
jgi:hypothetical protein